MKNALVVLLILTLPLLTVPQTFAQKAKHKAVKAAPVVQDTTTKAAPEAITKPPPEPIPIRQRRIAILPFENSTSYPQLAAQAEGDLTAQFVNSGRFEVVERGQLEKIIKEQALGMTGAVDPVQAADIGKLLGAKYVALGRVTQANPIQTGTNKGRPTFRGVANVDLRLVSTESGVVFFSRVGRGVNQPLLMNLIGTDSVEIVVGAVTLAVKDLIKAVENAIPIGGYIIAEKDSAHVTLDAGKTTGVKKGMKFKVYREGKPITHPVTGQILPGVKAWLADVEITFADESTAEARVTQWLTKTDRVLQIGDKFTSPEK